MHSGENSELKLTPDHTSVNSVGIAQSLGIDVTITPFTMQTNSTNNPPVSNGTLVNDDPATPNLSSAHVERRGRKPLKDGLTQETFFTLSHSLRGLAACKRYLLNSKGFKLVLPGRINNDPIEMSFSIARAMAGGNSHLDICAYLYAQRTLLIRAIYDICANPDFSHNREAYNQLFEGIHEKTSALEQITKGKGLDSDDQMFVEYSKSLIAELDRKGLSWPTALMVVMSGLVLNVVDVIVADKKMLRQFNESTSASRVGLRVIKTFLRKRINLCRMLMPLRDRCLDCDSDRSDTIVKPTLNTLYNVACNNMSLLLNRKCAATMVTLSIVKADTKKGRPTSIRGTEGSTYTHDNSGKWTTDRDNIIYFKNGKYL
ncbi:hypothetical protein SARC_03742 [Sphaeroforma arctica JP610]|uniref:Uncharacterized protein n=1 Tax=Sphaeroforma arctica JP610 TaxID=667725 RepID=A0A0L0G4M8_9EUKA|nr:hypothetical protein SARC_03742 [Sphaeroforma arctica JP610]KNC84032.1 hypothetical protein SARC_03742 [Sphaeroforma arctica JP610]|eukprot:XP_014157934.1 hypothetical protein SARC_03742 [Sphaeroforma arctica JP610]